jgi:hypothetical protein
MQGKTGFRCEGCGEWHEELPFSYHYTAPAYWRPEFGRERGSDLTEDQCIIGDEHFFVRALIRIPVLDAGQDFEWGVWVSLSQENFWRMTELWTTEGREAEPAYFGWLSTELPTYAQSTLLLSTDVHSQPVGCRPLVELERTEHPLAIEQREGTTLTHVRKLAEQLLHEPA